MNYINITVRGKMARAEERARVVCGNSDYTVCFDFDEEWAEYAVKTARFVSEDGSYTDVQFEGSDCTVPILRNTRTLLVGVFAGNLRTTTAAVIHTVPCITDPDGTPADPTPDVYAQLMERFNAMEAPAAVLYTEQNLTDEQKAQARDNIGVNESLGMTGATVGQTVKIKSVDASGAPTEWEAVDIPQSDWRQTDESAADYVKNRPFGDFVHHNIDFKVGEGVGTVTKSPTFAELRSAVGEKTAHIKQRYGVTTYQGKAVTMLDESYGNIIITFTSDDNLNELVFSGQSGNLDTLTINKSNITWSTWDTYSLFIDGLDYIVYKKLSRDSVEGTLPYVGEKDYIPVSEEDGSWVTRSIESINPIFQLSGASAGQIVKITAVDESGKPTSWEAVDMPSGGEREWIKIGEVTNAEDTAGPFYVKFTKDINGNSLSLKGVIIIGTPLFSDTNTHSCALKCNDFPSGGSANFFLYRSILRNKQTFTIYSEFLRCDGLNSVVVTVSNSGNVKQNGGAESFINTWSPTKEEFLQFPIRGIDFGVLDSGLLAGSKFEFWGVKA